MTASLLASISQIKQAFGCGVPNDAEWRPTTNARNKMMLKDMKEFASQVRRMHGDVSQWRDAVGREYARVQTQCDNSEQQAAHGAPTSTCLHRSACAGGIGTMKGVLECKLPRAFMESATGVAPVDPDTHLVGQGVRTDAFNGAVETMQTDIQKILSSLEGWLNSYKEIKASRGNGMRDKHRLWCMAACDVVRVAWWWLLLGKLCSQQLSRCRRVDR